MRCETWLARLVFAAGALVMIATSPPPKWHERQQLSGQLQSEGQGDDRLLRVRVRMTEGIAKDVIAVNVNLTGSVDRPASDLTIAWRDERFEAADAGAPQPLSTSEDFLTVYAGAGDWEGCPDEHACEMVFEARIATESSVGYTMMLHVSVELTGAREKTPRGEFEADLEVLDAP